MLKSKNCADPFGGDLHPRDPALRARVEFCHPGKENQANPFILQLNPLRICQFLSPLNRLFDPRPQPADTFCSG